ncbi:MAG: DNA polymerase III subunit gamma/tau [Alphaproteobacteria bacterium]|jgi:DNA polymerase-3 subunit gamma/tau|nr:DNA polymerase III subunit gamma/tau [Alphaproteobacteria bacterium]
MDDDPSKPGGDEAAVYQVLARKYRPQTFEALIGQDAMVQTLTNAIRQDRIAHAFVLTGVRGIGKTTTARLIARALNCTGADGTGGPTVTPCGVCESCVGIADSRHMDVLEMDAASRTGVDDIRELLDGVRYRPVSARFKVYIIDEVHMLTRNAFNALLKTLEEPPPGVKFIFATTEIRKIPVTVLSRCQRFDLRRVEVAVLERHFAEIAAEEGREVEDQALALIARAAEGSVRDGLSLLDQAMAHAAGPISGQVVREMLGLADAEAVYDLFEALMRGDMGVALTGLGRQYDLGVDPEVVLQDLLELAHWLTRLKVVPGAENEGAASEIERTRGRALADRLSMAVLARAWQMLLKGLGEVRAAPSPLAAVEMVLVRLAYSADLPPPAEVVAELKAKDVGAAAAAPPRPSPAPSEARAEAPGTASAAPLAAEPERAPAPRPEEAPSATRNEPPVESFEALVALAAERKEGVLSGLLHQNIRLVRFEPGRLVCQPVGLPASELVALLGQKLQELTGQRWAVEIDEEAESQPTLAERATAARESRFTEARDHPTVQAVLETFPGAEIKAVRELGATPENEEG